MTVLQRRYVYAPPAYQSLTWRFDLDRGPGQLLRFGVLVRPLFNAEVSLRVDINNLILAEADRALCRALERAANGPRRRGWFFLVMEQPAYVFENDRPSAMVRIERTRAIECRIDLVEWRDVPIPGRRSACK